MKASTNPNQRYEIWRLASKALGTVVWVRFLEESFDHSGATVVTVVNYMLTTHGNTHDDDYDSRKSDQ